jgi:hypothetical protein
MALQCFRSINCAPVTYGKRPRWSSAKQPYLGLDGNPANDLVGSAGLQIVLARFMNPSAQYFPRMQIRQLAYLTIINQPKKSQGDQLEHTPRLRRSSPNLRAYCCQGCEAETASSGSIGLTAETLTPHALTPIANRIPTPLPTKSAAGCMCHPASSYPPAHRQPAHHPCKRPGPRVDPMVHGRWTELQIENRMRLDSPQATIVETRACICRLGSRDWPPFTRNCRSLLPLCSLVS